MGLTSASSITDRGLYILLLGLQYRPAKHFMLLRPKAAYHSIDLTSAVHMHTEYALQAAVKTDVDTYTASDKRTLELEGHRMMCCAAPWEQEHAWLQRMLIQGFAARKACHQPLRP